ncbi:hypothetical protein BCR44DRAFT_268566 [Catenaria anguillulae PL171]|uniref:Uncharacterized protein n=1 Tax=Catenaria anguillulae PL171 TaxID=765915 RepID=A0A1Y2HCZ7_9FUNG|nr:hypothetical protein BCR44DRAFT_268566 [Catenaria anguillulae PL171]
MSIRPTFLDWPLFRSDVFDVMVNQLRFVPRYLSPGAMCRWLYDNGFEPDSESHASIAPAAGTRSHFLDVFHEHDDGYLSQVTRRSDEHHHLYWRCELLGMLWLLEGSANRLTSFDSDDDSVSDGEKWFW